MYRRSRKSRGPRENGEIVGQTPLDAVRRLTAEWLNKDAAGMSRWLADDVIEIGPACRAPLEGKPRFFRSYHNYLRGPDKILSYRILKPRTVLLGDAHAFVYFNYRMRTQLDGLIEDSHGKESMLTEKVRSGWRVKFIHWHRD